MPTDSQMREDAFKRWCVAFERNDSSMRSRDEFDFAYAAGRSAERRECAQIARLSDENCDAGCGQMIAAAILKRKEEK